MSLLASSVPAATDPIDADVRCIDATGDGSQINHQQTRARDELPQRRHQRRPGVDGVACRVAVWCRQHEPTFPAA